MGGMRNSNAECLRDLCESPQVGWQIAAHIAARLVVDAPPALDAALNEAFAEHSDMIVRGSD